MFRLHQLRGHSILIRGQDERERGGRVSNNVFFVQAEGIKTVQALRGGGVKNGKIMST